MTCTRLTFEKKAELFEAFLKTIEQSGLDYTLEKVQGSKTITVKDLDIIVDIAPPGFCNTITPDGEMRIFPHYSTRQSFAIWINSSDDTGYITEALKCHFAE